MFFGSTACFASKQAMSDGDVIELTSEPPPPAGAGARPLIATQQPYPSTDSWQPADRRQSPAHAGNGGKRPRAGDAEEEQRRRRIMQFRPAAGAPPPQELAPEDGPLPEPAAPADDDEVAARSHLMSFARQKFAGGAGPATAVAPEAAAGSSLVAPLHAERVARRCTARPAPASARDARHYTALLWRSNGAVEGSAYASLPFANSAKGRDVKVVAATSHLESSTG